MERRIIVTEFKTRESEDGKLTVIGRAILYEQETVLWSGGSYEEREIIKQGAAAETIQLDDIRALWNHMTYIVLGRNKAGTLRLVDAEGGVDVEIDCPNTEEGRSKYESIKRGDVTQMSFGFDDLEVIERVIREGDKKIYIREVVKLKLWEVSPVTFPAYENTSIEARSKDLQQRMEKIEALLSETSECRDGATASREALLMEQEIKLLEV